MIALPVSIHLPARLREAFQRDESIADDLFGVNHVDQQTIAPAHFHFANDMWLRKRLSCFNKNLLPEVGVLFTNENYSQLNTSH